MRLETDIIEVRKTREEDIKAEVDFLIENLEKEVTVERLIGEKMNQLQDKKSQSTNLLPKHSNNTNPPNQHLRLIMRSKQKQAINLKS